MKMQLTKRVAGNGKVEVRMSMDKYFIISDEDYDWVSKRFWTLTKSGYVVSGKPNRYDYLHKIIVKAKGRQKVIHLNGDLMDNRRENLAITNYSTLLQRRNPRRNSDHLLGAIYDKERDRWVAQISYQGKHYHLGRYRTEEEAHHAYVRKAKELHGNLARFE